MVKLAETSRDIPSQGLVVIDFFATWCGPCRKIAPVYEQFPQQYPKITFLKVDVDESPELVAQYDISAMPTFVFLKDGAIVKKVEGADVRGLKDGFTLLGY